MCEGRSEPEGISAVLLLVTLSNKLNGGRLIKQSKSQGNACSNDKTILTTKLVISNPFAFIDSMGPLDLHTFKTIQSFSKINQSRLSRLMVFRHNFEISKIQLIGRTSKDM